MIDPTGRKTVVAGYAIAATASAVGAWSPVARRDARDQHATRLCEERQRSQR
jgi:hypothetical protein